MTKQINLYVVLKVCRKLDQDGRAKQTYRIILDSSMVEHSAVNRRVVGSSPTRGVLRLLGQAVKTSPFHGGNRGSIPLGVIADFQR